MNNQPIDFVADGNLDQVSGGVSCKDAVAMAGALKALADLLGQVGYLAGNSRVISEGTYVAGVGMGLIGGACGK